MTAFARLRKCERGLRRSTGDGRHCGTDQCAEFPGTGFVGEAAAKEEVVYGWQLTSQQARIAYRAKMRSLKT